MALSMNPPPHNLWDVLKVLAFVSVFLLGRELLRNSMWVPRACTIFLARNYFNWRARHGNDATRAKYRERAVRTLEKMRELNRERVAAGDKT